MKFGTFGDETEDYEEPPRKIPRTATHTSLDVIRDFLDAPMPEIASHRIAELAADALGIQESELYSPGYGRRFALLHKIVQMRRDLRNVFEEAQNTLKHTSSKLGEALERHERYEVLALVRSALSNYEIAKPPATQELAAVVQAAAEFFQNPAFAGFSSTAPVASLGATLKANLANDPVAAELLMEKLAHILNSYQTVVDNLTFVRVASLHNEYPLPDIMARMSAAAQAQADEVTLLEKSAQAGQTTDMLDRVEYLYTGAREAERALLSIPEVPPELNAAAMTALRNAVTTVNNTLARIARTMWYRGPAPTRRAELHAMMAQYPEECADVIVEARRSTDRRLGDIHHTSSYTMALTFNSGSALAALLQKYMPA